VHQVHDVTSDFDALLAQSVEPALKSVGVKDAPISQQGVQPVARDASLPALPEVDGLSIAVQPVAKRAQRIGGQPTAFLNDSQSAVIIHAADPYVGVAGRWQRGLR
jgi:hypothetical protein